MVSSWIFIFMGHMLWQIPSTCYLVQLPESMQLMKLLTQQGLAFPSLLCGWLCSCLQPTELYCHCHSQCSSLWELLLLPYHGPLLTSTSQNQVSGFLLSTLASIQRLIMSLLYFYGASHSSPSTSISLNECLLFLIWSFSIETCSSYV